MKNKAKNIDPYIFTPISIEEDSVKIIYRIGPNHTCEIIDIYSTIRNQGNGTRVYKKFQLEMKNKYGVKNIYAFARFSNNSAARWYDRMGFTIGVIEAFYHDEIDEKAFLCTKKIEY